MRALFMQVLSQTPVVWVGQLAPRVKQLIQLALQPTGPDAELPGGQARLLIAQGERDPQHRCHVLGEEADGAARLGLAQLSQVLQQMPETLLLEPIATSWPRLV